MPKRNEKQQIYLEPCPFCGGEGISDAVYNFANGYARIVCKSCGASTKKYEISIDYSAMGEAISAWNRRE